MKIFHLHNLAWNSHLFCWKSKTIKDFIPTRCHSLSPLEPEPKVKIEVPKPQRTEDPMTVEPEYDCALDKLGQLDKHHKNKYFGFYGKYFRESHARSLKFLQISNATSCWTSTLSF